MCFVTAQLRELTWSEQKKNSSSKWLDANTRRMFENVVRTYTARTHQYIGRLLQATRRNTRRQVCFRCKHVTSNVEIFRYDDAHVIATTPVFLSPINSKQEWYLQKQMALSSSPRQTTEIIVIATEAVCVWGNYETAKK